jgi:glycosyltransferase involved in cell wall biosynthesis
MYTFSSQNKFDHAQGTVVDENNLSQVQSDVGKADIIHLKGDWPHDGSYCGIDLGNKPIVISVSGSLFRKREYGGLGKYDMSAYDNCDVKTALSLDLCYEDFSDIWIPYPIETEGVPVLWEYKEIPLLTHSPTRRISKNTNFAVDVFEAIKDRYLSEVRLLEGLSFSDADKERRRSTIFFDQFKVGFYGNSAIEAMRYGVPVATWLYPDLRWGDIEYYCPVFTHRRNPDEWADILIERLSSIEFMKMWSRTTRRWCEDVHSYRAVAKKLTNIYRQL